MTREQRITIGRMRRRTPQAIAKQIHFHIYPDGHIGMVATEIHRDPEWRAEQEQKGGSQ